MSTETLRFDVTSTANIQTALQNQKNAFSVIKSGGDQSEITIKSVSFC